MKYVSWLILGAIVGAAIMWTIDHWALIQNREKISGAGEILSGAQKIFGGA